MWTDAAIRVIPTKRLQATIDTQNAKLEHERYQREEAAHKVKYDRLVREIATWTLGETGILGSKVSAALHRRDSQRVKLGKGLRMAAPDAQGGVRNPR